MLIGAKCQVVPHSAKPSILTTIIKPSNNWWFCESISVVSLKKTKKKSSKESSEHDYSDVCLEKLCLP